MLTELMLFFLSPLSIGSINSNIDILKETSNSIVSLYRKPKTIFDIKKTMTYDVFHDDSLQRYVGRWVCLNDIHYIPNDLVKIEKKEYLTISPLCWDCLFRSIALKDLYRMFEAFNKKFWKKITVNSAYRSYESQQNLKVHNHSKDKVSQAWTSEHQLGLAVDISVIILSPEEKQWVKDNAYLYGFVFSYQKGVHIDWYMEEDWYLRYIGNILAKELKQRNKTLSEWLGYNYEESKDYICKENNIEKNKKYFINKKLKQFKKLLSL